jgi:hypothetical protein
MRVNSAVKSFFKIQLVERSGIAAIMFVIFIIASSFTPWHGRDLRSKEVNLIIRQLGDQLLILAGDTKSRVLPVSEVKEGTFLLGFENEFVFNHDSLMMLSQRLLNRTQFPSGYTVTVHECVNASIVFGFQINNASPDIMPCKNRSEPRGCYTIEIAFPDLYKNVESKANIEPLTDGLKLSHGDTEVNPKPEELTSFEAIDQETNSLPLSIESKEFETTTSGFPLINLVYGTGLLMLLGVTFMIGRFGKRLIPVPVQNQNHTIIKEFVPELPTLGKFLFDAKDKCLLFESNVISLTDKEFKILELLNNNFGELISRETLMDKIWISEGVITGRSLDMFVSKLRKKLSSDPELRITNVHGKGYKLEIAGV